MPLTSLVINLSLGNDELRIFTLPICFDKELLQSLPPEGPQQLKLTDRHWQWLQLNVDFDHPPATSDRQPEIAHVVHLACWKLIKQTRQVTALSLWRFSQSTYPMFESTGMSSTSESTGSRRDDKVDSLVGFPGSMSLDWKYRTGGPSGNADHCGMQELLLNILQLPSEMQRLITGHCASTFASAMLTVANVTPGLLDSLDRSCLVGAGLKRCRIKQILSKINPETLYAEPLCLYGHRYISKLIFDDPRGVPIKSSKIRGFRFVLGRYGLRAIRFLYANGTKSPWAGFPGKGWYGTMPGDNLGLLLATTDVSASLKIVTLSELVEPENSSPRFPRLSKESYRTPSALEQGSRLQLQASSPNSATISATSNRTFRL